MIKVIGFDAWTIGRHHYLRLLEAFRNEGLELSLIHLGSWGNEKGRQPEEHLETMLVRDISYYSGRSFSEIIDLERPDVVLFLSTDAFAHRAFNRYCHQRAVPTVHLYHGLQQLMYSAPLKYNPVARMWFLRSHLIKSIRHYWPVYAKALWETSASVGEWGRFARDLVQRALAIRSKRVAGDSKATRACVYIDSEVGFAMQSYGYDEPEVTAVGNPDLIDFGMPPSMVGSHLDGGASDSDQVTYIDTALTEYGHGSRDDFIDHVRRTSDELSAQGKRMVFKPHPSTAASGLVSAVSEAGIETCSNEDFIQRLRQSCACITEPSTAALVPALAGMPLFLAQYGRLDGQRFGDLLSAYPRAAYLSDLKQFGTLLEEARANSNAQRTLEWIKQNTGPLPASEMPKRVADVVKSLVVDSGRA